MPASNAFVERIFSACTWFDDPLRQRLKPAHFVMSVLLAVNEAMLIETVPTDEEAQAIVEVISFTYLGSSFVLGVF